MPLDAKAKTEAEARLCHGLVGQVLAGGRWVGTPILELNSRYSLWIESSWHYFDAASSPDPIDLWEKASIPPVEDLMFLACKLRYAKIMQLDWAKRLRICSSRLTQGNAWPFLAMILSMNVGA